MSALLGLDLHRLDGGHRPDHAPKRRAAQPAKEGSVPNARFEQTQVRPVRQLRDAAKTEIDNSVWRVEAAANLLGRNLSGSLHRTDHNAHAGAKAGSRQNSVRRRWVCPV